MNDNFIVVLLMLIFLIIIVYSVFLKAELVNNFSDDFCKKKKVSPLILDSRLFEIEENSQNIDVVSFTYVLDVDFLVSLRNKWYKEYKVLCSVYTPICTRELVCSRFTRNNETSCTLDFPNTFNLKFKEEKKMNKSICHLILFK